MHLRHDAKIAPILRFMGAAAEPWDDVGPVRSVMDTMQAITWIIGEYSCRPEPTESGTVRFPVRNCIAEVSIADEPSRPSTEMRVRDIGFRGIGLLASDPVELGKTLLIRIRPAAVLRGVVAGCTPLDGEQLIGVRLVQSDTPPACPAQG